MALKVRTDKQLKQALDALAGAERISKEDIIRAVLERYERAGHAERVEGPPWGSAHLDYPCVQRDVAKFGRGTTPAARTRCAASLTGTRRVYFFLYRRFPSRNSEIDFSIRRCRVSAAFAPLMLSM
jgi:hypothetical protein